MTLKEQVKQDLERLDESGIREVADFVEFLQFRSRRVTQFFDYRARRHLVG